MNQTLPISRSLGPILWASLLCSLTAPQLAAQSDDFNDGILGPQWIAFADNPLSLAQPPIRVVEQNGRLEVIAESPSSPNLDGGIVSSPSFLLATSSNFEISVDFNFSGTFANQTPGDALSIFFGVGRDFPDGTDSAAIGYGVLTAEVFNNPFTSTGPTAAWRINDVQTTQVPPGPLFLNPASGTFRIIYDALDDLLTFRIDGSDPFTPTTPNIVQGVWGASSLYVSMGARGLSHSLQPGSTWFDNFTVVEGQIIPEPNASWLLLPLLSLTFLSRPTRQRKQKNIR